MSTKIWQTNFTSQMGVCLYFDRENVIKINDDIEFSLVPVADPLIGNKKKFQVENIKGVFEIFSIVKDRYSGQFNKETLTFICEPDHNNSQRIFCTVEVGKDMQYNKTSYACIPYTLKKSASHMQFLKLYDFNEGVITLPYYSMLKFNYFLKKINLYLCELVIENPYDGLKINGINGGLRFQMSMYEDFVVKLSFEFDPTVIQKYFENLKSVKTQEIASDSETEMPETTSPFFNIFKNPKFADVILISSDDIEIPSHRNILSEYSKVFAATFEEPANPPHRMNIIEFDAETINSAFKFCFGNPNESFQCTPEIFKFINKFEISPLSDHCCTMMKDKLCVDNVCEIVGIAYLSGFLELKNICIKLLSNSKLLIETSKFNELPKQVLVDLLFA